MSTEIAVLSPEDRAEQAIGFADTKAKLVALASESVRIVEITGKPGYEECHAARMRLKNTRVEIEKRGKEAREDATKFSKAVIAKENELVAVISPEEDRLEALQAAWDAERAKEKAERERLERERAQALQAKIDALKNLPVTVMNRSVEDIDAATATAEAFDVSEFAGEQQLHAEGARDGTLATLATMREARIAYDAEQERLAQERADLERQRAEQAEIDRVAREKREEEDRIAQVERQRLADEAAEVERQAAAERREQEEQERAERQRQEAADREERRKEQEAEADRQRAEAQRLADERAEIERQKQADAAAARRREIASATLKGTAAEARDRLIELGDAETTLVAKLAAVLKLDQQQVAA